jgi:hypothetical protein
MGGPKHQHFIPRSYLKNFAEKRDEQYWVDTVMRGEQQQIKTLPITSVCVQKNLYTLAVRDGEDRFAIEKYYASEVDGVYPAVYRMLADKSVSLITTEEKHRILNTILSLFFRTPRFLNQRITGIYQLFEQLAEAGGEDGEMLSIELPDGGRREFIRKDLDAEWEACIQQAKADFLVSHMEEWRKFVDFKMGCGLEVITVPEELPLITCDNPVVVLGLNGQPNYEDAFAINNIIEVPIDKLSYLIIYPNNVSGDDTLRILRNQRDKHFSAGVNLTTQKNSDGRLIAFPGDLSAHFSSQESLGAFTEENVAHYLDFAQKTTLLWELTRLIQQNDTALCNPVANKVKELMKLPSMAEEPMIKKLVQLLTVHGYF